MKNFDLKKIVKNPKLYASVLSGVIAVTSLSGCVNKDKGNQDSAVTAEVTTKIFNEGEHYISSKYNFEVLRMEPNELDCPVGYKIVDVECVDKYDKRYIFIISYVNTVPVECAPNELGEYSNFGTPIEQEKTLTLENSCK